MAKTTVKKKSAFSELLAAYRAEQAKKSDVTFKFRGETVTVTVAAASDVRFPALLNKGDFLGAIEILLDRPTFASVQRKMLDKNGHLSIEPILEFLDLFSDEYGDTHGGKSQA